MTVPEGTWGVILASADSRGESEVIGRAIEAGRSIFTIDFTEGTDRSSLLGLLGREFLFPYEARDFDVALDLLADLDWFGNDDGYLYVLRNIELLERADQGLFENFVDMLSNLCDRWHSGGTPFDVLVIAPAETRKRIRPILDRWDELLRTGRWVDNLNPVPIVECDD